MDELALFAGAGGGLLGSRLLGWRTVCAVEKEPYAREVLLRRQRDGMLDLFPIWDEVQTFDGRPWRGVVDIVTAGFPCQPWSQAGAAKGEGDERNLWPDTMRVIREVGPAHILLENVPALLAHAFIRSIFGDLAACGFDCRWDCIPAAAVGAPHRRDRLWIHGHTDRHGQSTCAVDAEAPGRTAMGDTDSIGCEGVHGRQQKSELAVRGPQVADTNGPRLEVGQQGKGVKQPAAQRGSWWESEPGVGRVAHGVAHRMDRLVCVGNGQVPAVVRRAWTSSQGVSTLRQRRRRTVTSSA